MKTHAPDHSCSASSYTVDAPCRVHGRVCSTYLTAYACGVTLALGCLGKPVNPPKAKETIR